MLQPNALRCISLWLNIVFYQSFTLYSWTFLNIYTFQVQNSIQCASASTWIYAAAKKNILFCSTIWGLFRDMQKKYALKTVQTEASSFVSSSFDQYFPPVSKISYHVTFLPHKPHLHIFCLNRVGGGGALWHHFVGISKWVGGGTMTSLCMHVRVGGHYDITLYACQCGGGHYDITLYACQCGGALWHHFVCMSEWGGHYDITLYACQSGGELWHHCMHLRVGGGTMTSLCRHLRVWGGTMTSLCMHLRVVGGALWHHFVGISECGGGTMTSLCRHLRVGGGGLWHHFVGISEWGGTMTSLCSQQPSFLRSITV